MIIKNIKDKIKGYFLTNPTSKMRVRQIERELGLPLPSVIRYCKELERERILKGEKISNIHLYSADRSSKRYLAEKRLFNLSLIVECGLVDYLIDEYSNPVIVLFGSYSRGEDIESSDVDLYVQTPSKKEIKMEKFEKILGRNIQLFIYSDLRQVKNVHLINNILNGVTLNGFLEAFK